MAALLIKTLNVMTKRARQAGALFLSSSDTKCTESVVWHEMSQ